MAYTLPTTGTDPKYTTKGLLEALIDSAIAAVSSTAISGFIYATDTTDGLARTSDGEGFFTASDLQLIFWLNEAGTATQLSEIGTPLTQAQVEELQANYATITAAALQVSEDAAQVALDRVATGADRVATGVDVVEAQDARDLAETYAGVVSRATSVAGLTDPTTLVIGDTGYVNGSGDPAVDGVYEVQDDTGNVWVRVGDTGLTGIQVQIDALPPTISKASRVEFATTISTAATGGFTMAYRLPNDMTFDEVYARIDGGTGEFTGQIWIADAPVGSEFTVNAATPPVHLTGLSLNGEKGDSVVLQVTSVTGTATDIFAQIEGEN